MTITVIAKIDEEPAIGFMIDAKNYVETFEDLYTELQLEIEETMGAVTAKGSSNSESNVVRDRLRTVRTENTKENDKHTKDNGKVSDGGIR